MRGSRAERRSAARMLGCLTATAMIFLIAAGSGGAARASNAAQAGGTPSRCSQPRPTQALAPTTVTTIGQAYWCIFEHYYGGPTLDDRVLLAGAFAALTQELDRLDRD